MGNKGIYSIPNNDKSIYTTIARHHQILYEHIENYIDELLGKYDISLPYKMLENAILREIYNIYELKYDKLLIPMIKRHYDFAKGDKDNLDDPLHYEIDDIFYVYDDMDYNVVDCADIFKYVTDPHTFYGLYIEYRKMFNIYCIKNEKECIDFGDIGLVEFKKLDLDDMKRYILKEMRNIINNNIYDDGCDFILYVYRKYFDLIED